MRHGHKVHVVEIDPAVYAYARGFFNLDQPHAVHFVDARSWVREQLTLLRSTSTSTSASTDPGTQQPESSRFSMVVHDCFSGGGVPSHLFTLEFWEELKGTMTADGVVAVNFAGHVGSEASRTVWLTLQDAFSPEKGGRGCRAFHDAVDEKGGTPETVKKDEFLNVVFFCQKEEGRREGRSWVRFRNAREKDYLQSWLRRMVLSTLLEREIEPRQVTGVSDAEGSGKAWILTDYNYHSLDYWQRDTAVEHWSSGYSLLRIIICLRSPNPSSHAAAYATQCLGDILVCLYLRTRFYIIFRTIHTYIYVSHTQLPHWHLHARCSHSAHPLHVLRLLGCVVDRGHCDSHSHAFVHGHGLRGPITLEELGAREVALSDRADAAARAAALGRALVAQDDLQVTGLRLDEVLDELGGFLCQFPEEIASDSH